MAQNAQIAYVSTGNPDTINESAPYIGAGPFAGQITQFPDGYTRMYVQLSASSGAGAAKKLAFWVTRGSVVTTTLSQSTRNEVAGVFGTTVTAGNYCWIKVKGPGVSVKSDGGGAAGDIAIANSGTNSDVTNIAAGTAPTYVAVGIITAAASGGNIAVDLNIPTVV